MTDAYFDWHARGKQVTLVSGTNAEADAIDDAIQQRRPPCTATPPTRRRVGLAVDAAGLYVGFTLSLPSNIAVLQRGIPELMT
ncbi:hypothetical protein LXM50_13360 [Microbacterium sp. Au-Mic1]|uniref:hypothetical protein n=1 Tax=Microbacterium sp. Au-Mic1 TaxID=2906457 RepID=UPI001E56C644|nr:hypothetical protein [Microbacterium sp. Au-Mic1]MCE4026961.1 hypothetical protein [Microbacterium sp. Au-Mic1]